MPDLERLRRIAEMEFFTLYRHDNMPHPQWQGVSSFPKHFHCGDQKTVVESALAADPEQALRQFLTFAGSKITSGG